MVIGRKLRILLIEDDDARVKKFRSWLPQDFVLTHAKSGGQALGFLRRLRKGEVAGILLDHDLDQQALTQHDLKLSGSSLIDLILMHVDRDVEILIHSQNPVMAVRMASRLSNNGYSVLQIPMKALTHQAFLTWLEEIREMHEE